VGGDGRRIIEAGGDGFSTSWQTLARSDPEWNEQVFSLQDEWIRFKVSSAKPHPIRLTAAAPSGNPGLFKDAAIQVRYRWNPDAGANPQLILSSRSRSGNAGVEAELAEREIRLRVDGTAKFDKSWPRPKPLKPGDEGLFELAAVGQRLIVRLNGETVLAEDHAEMNRTGGLSVQVRGCGLRLKDAEHVNLDGIADPLKALGWRGRIRGIWPGDCHEGNSIHQLPRHEVRPGSRHRHSHVHP
jgi:hypothetical protein